MLGVCRKWLLVGLVGITATWAALPGAAEPGGNSFQGHGGGLPLGSGLQSHVISEPGRQHTVVVTDPVAKVVAVYFVDPGTGALALKSVRNVTWDLKMLQFNSGEPTPQDVRAGLPR